MGVSVLYDGWPLAYRPDSPAALHLHTLLTYLPEGIQAHLAMPSESALPLPSGITAHHHAVSGAPGEAARLRWEQIRLPRLGRQLSVDVFHVIGGAPALLGATDNLFSPTGWEAWPMLPVHLERKAGLAVRMRDALAQGGLTRLGGVIWPEDLPEPALSAPLIRLPYLTHPVFLPVTNSDARSNFGGDGGLKGSRSEQALELPESYILYHGPSTARDLRRLLDAWSWAAGSIGEYYPLLLIGLDVKSQGTLDAFLRDYRLADTVRALPQLSLVALAAIYRGCSAVFHPAPDSPWEGALRLALTCEKPIVALETPWADALAGPAAYLVPPYESGDAQPRALGAALISTVVEESLAMSLAQAASQRSVPWKSTEQIQRFKQGLQSAYTLFAAQQTSGK